MMPLTLAEIGEENRIKKIGGRHTSKISVLLWAELLR